jgi:hypothetical protein
VYGYAPSYVIGAGISLIGLPCLVLSRRQNEPADTVEQVAAEPVGVDARAPST